VIFVGLPPTLPLTAFSPAFVRSLINSLSNSVSAAKMWNINLPAIAYSTADFNPSLSALLSEPFYLQRFDHSQLALMRLVGGRSFGRRWRCGNSLFS